MTALLRLENADGVARLTFDNPRRLNAINAEMWQALPGLLGRIAEDPEVRVLILAGEGERAFCTGNDVSEFETIRATPEAAARYNAWQHDVGERLRGLQKPVIAAVHGHCLGAGLEMALMSDFRVCSAQASMGIPAVKLGLPYRLEDIETVAAVIGPACAREMVLLGRSYSGEALLAMGLANRVLPDRASAMSEAEALAREMTEFAPLSLAAAKVGFQELLRRSGPPDRSRAQAAADRCYASEDYAEGRRARAEKRPARFRGR
ncbi:enoyl-CoA hydratase-related protein [Sabulicella rubraurantiaca]|uniref:enoyl-CoA hydratase-related protein n=1 Tax=Sabulicella rubraurantiaca TaxID=2811429 RepID=UPI001A972C15|nr:enoyl-CoA hydratase-related protein [Sabulicella rubraurantiaca]